MPSRSRSSGDSTALSVISKRRLMLLIHAILPTQIAEIADRPCRDLRYTDDMVLENIQEAPPARAQASEKPVTLEQLLEQALALSRENRETLVDALQASLDIEGPDVARLGPEEQAQWDAAWGAEIRRRMDDIRSGQGKTYSFEEVMSELSARVHQP